MPQAVTEGANGEINGANDKRGSRGYTGTEGMYVQAELARNKGRSDSTRTGLRAAELQELTGSLRIGVRLAMCKVSKMHP